LRKEKEEKKLKTKEKFIAIDLKITKKLLKSLKKPYKNCYFHFETTVQITNQNARTGSSS
jgi:phosphopantothenoylcysteine synthetase/decarboxylase